MMLSADHRKLLEAWMEHGIPDDVATRDNALTVIVPRLWEAYVEAEAIAQDFIRNGFQRPGNGQRFEVHDPALPGEGESLVPSCPFCGKPMRREVVDAEDGHTKVHYGCLLLFRAAYRRDLEARQDAQASADINESEPF